MSSGRYYVEERHNVLVQGNVRATRFVVMDSKTGKIARATKDRAPYYSRNEAQRVVNSRNSD